MRTRNSDVAIAFPWTICLIIAKKTSRGLSKVNGFTRLIGANVVAGGLTPTASGGVPLVTDIFLSYAWYFVSVLVFCRVRCMFSLMGSWIGREISGDVLIATLNKQIRGINVFSLTVLVYLRLYNVEVLGWSCWNSIDLASIKFNPLPRTNR